MPYIAQTDREGALRYPETPGELNFAVCSLADYYVESHGLNYRTINDILGALEGAKLEIYRRIASPYEDMKCAQNGEVFQNHVGVAMREGEA